jgi:hypothetical protein
MNLPGLLKAIQEQPLPTQQEVRQHINDAFRQIQKLDQPLYSVFTTEFEERLIAEMAQLIKNRDRFCFVVDESGKLVMVVASA